MEKINLNKVLRDMEIQYVKQALEHTGENMTRAADLLGIKRTCLIEKCKHLNITFRVPRKVFKPKKEMFRAEVKEVLKRHPNNIEDDLWNE